MSIQQSIRNEIDSDQLIILFGQKVLRQNLCNNPKQVMSYLEKLYQQLPRAVCGKVMNNIMAVKCETCSSDPFSIYCLECFEEEHHRGHKYQFKSAHGMCDCGFRFSIKEEAFCSKHYGSHVLKPLSEFSQYFDLEKVAEFIYELFVEYLNCIQNNNESKALQIQVLITQLFYTYPMDAFRRIITNLLFSSIKQINSPSDLTNDIDIKQMICPFVDIPQMMTDFKNKQDFSQYPLIALFSHLETLVHYQPLVSVQEITRHLVNDQISEPAYRSILLYYFYLKNDDLVKSTMLPLLEKQIGAKAVKTLWASAPVQLCSNIHLDDLHTIMFTVTELTGYLSAQLQLANLTPDESYQQLQCSGLEQFLLTGLNELKQLTSDENIVSLAHQKLLQALQMYKTLPELKPDADKVMIFELYNLKYKLLAEIYASSNVHYTAVQLSNPLVCFIYFLSMMPRSNTCLPRRRDQDCIEDDDTLVKNLHLISHENIKSFNFAWSAYCSAVVGTEFDRVIDLQSKIVRTNEEIKVELVKEAVNGLKIIENVLQTCLQFVLVNSTKNKNHFQYATNNYIPQAACTWGYHNAQPLIVSDVDEAQPVTYFVYNSYIPVISMMINAHEHYVKNSCDNGVKTAKMINNLLAKIRFTNQLPKYNAYIMQTFVMRSLLTHAMYVTNGFTRLGDTNKILNRFYAPEMCYCMNIYHYYNVLQQLLIEANLDHFIFQIFEIYGFAHPQTGKYTDRVVKNDPEGSDRMHRTLQRLICDLVTITYKDQTVSSPSQMKDKFVIHAFLQNFKPTEKILNTYLEEVPFHNADSFKQMYSELADKIEQNIVSTDLYQSQQTASYYQLNTKVLQQISIFDSFYNTLPQFTYNYQKYAELAKFDRITPGEIQNKPIICPAVFEHELVIQAVMQLTWLYLNSVHSFNETSQELILIFVALRQILIKSEISEFKLFSNEIITSQQIKLELNVLLQNGQIPAQLKQIIEIIVKQEQEQEKSKINVSDKMKQLKIKQNNTKSELLHITEDAIQNNIESNNEFDDELVKNIKLIQQFDSCCSICTGSENEKILSQYCYVLPDSILQQQLQNENEVQPPSIPKFQITTNKKDTLTQKMENEEEQFNIIIHTCTHRIHSECYKDEKSCAICRQSCNMILPAIGCENISLRQISTIIKSINLPFAQETEDFEEIRDQLKRFAESFQCVGIDLDILKNVLKVDLESAEATQKLLKLNIINYMESLVSFLVRLIYQNIKQFAIRQSLDVFSDMQQKERVYKELLSVISSLMLLALQIFNYLVDKLGQDYFYYESNVPSKTICDQIKRSILFNNEYSYALEPQIIKDCLAVFRVSKFDPALFAQLSNTHEDNIAALLSTPFKHLVTDQLSDPSEYYSSLKFAQRCQLITSISQPPLSTVNSVSPFKLNLAEFFKMDYVSLIKTFNKKKCACNSPAHLICLYCGQTICANCLSADHISQHSLTCQTNPVWFVVERNLLVFCLRDNSVYFTGAPYLDENNEDDCQRLKKVPIYLNGTLINQLKRTLLWKLEYKSDAQSGIDLDRIVSVVRGWFNVKDTEEE
ncbi:E3_ubiquitin-protein ligase [Hexamita inflata]|uniref:E3 ubiquitin-protein ligase n=1 Tax=Hexamita inflata TaxID=28002 RepID=A0AA86TRA8_9EUKA|nr:E3 ubiquitin-protein ligase [Hexamita inflata]